MLFLSTKTNTAGVFVSLVSLSLATASQAQQREDLKEPVYRVVNTNSGISDRPSPAVRPKLDTSVLPDSETIDERAVEGAAAVPAHFVNKHPALLSALQDAHVCLDHIQANVKDYSCLLLRRENVNGKLLAPEYIQAKIRQRQVKDGKTIVPFSVYMKFLRPEEVKGREILYVEGQFNGKMLVKEGGGGFKSRLPAVKLATTSPIVMRSCRYPISDVGIENLTQKLIERGVADDGNIANVDYTAEYRPGAKLNGRECKYLKVDFLTQKPINEAKRLEIFIDQQMHVPIRYVAYAWPAAEGERPPILEEYTYLNLKPNNGFKDVDFDQDNPNYNF